MKRHGIGVRQGGLGVGRERKEREGEERGSGN